MAGIVCKHLNKKYGEVEVVPDFNLEVEDHEFVVFLGPSGCGKSTILRMLAGLEDITGGELSIGGKIVNDAEPGDRGIAMVFQNYALYPHMSIKDNIAFGLRRLKTSKKEINERVDAVTKMLGLEPYLDRKPTELSGGQQQRVAIARAMIKTPDVFLFDEPLSNLDAKLRAHMRYEIARLHKELKTTSVYVTHDQMEAMTLADRIVLLNAGEIEQVGSPEEIYDYPETLFVAGFIGTPSMSFLDLDVSKTSDGWTLSGTGIVLEIAGEQFALNENAKVVMGIRPSKFHLVDKPIHGKTVTSRAEFVEFHGDEVLVGFSIGETQITAFVKAGNRPQEGDTVHFAVEENEIHLFDKKSERTLRQGTSPSAASPVLAEVGT
ncbi:ABC transporter ATP-binding protein [Pseudorhodobacter wandonensis]|uniref:ABC transporter ATP-binding protein n=1 Tax=Pseudorhodobacter wandonensis TaxID=1120568 RepID=UPI00067AE6DA|nr:sn-glycerol-3-phosphate ABC transporter ATP-binding protein UgpC [Pseudorhodobacter wandonensis]